YKIEPDPRFAIERGRGGDGYDVMDAVGQPPAWTAVSSWGHDGWDLGRWPYVVIYTRRHGDRHQLAQYVEGDVDAYSYSTREELYAAIDHLAFFYWHNHDESWVAGISDSNHMPEQLCGPFQRSRLDAEQEAN
ncbi:MAG: hypothetical protein ACRDNS_10300, partial [Trebonia sp.]